MSAIAWRVISLFSGAGFMDLAFSLARFKIVAQVEIDSYCQQILATRRDQFFPDARLFEDVRHVGKHNLPDADVVIGGFPCQDISVAGKRAGVGSETRSGLWWEFARIISEVRPKLVLLENVPAICFPFKGWKHYPRKGKPVVFVQQRKAVTAPPAALEVIRELARIGYVGEYANLRASDVGAPHRRNRWWCIATDALSNTQSERFGVGRIAVNDKQKLAKFTRDDSHDVAHAARNGWLGGCGIGSLSESVCAQAEDANGRREAQFLVIPASSEREAGGEIEGGIRARVSDGLHVNVVGGRRAPRQYATVAYGSKAKPDVGRVRVDGRAFGMDKRGHYDYWAAAPNARPFSYEAPRVTTDRTYRSPRLKAIGNGVVVPLVYQLALVCREKLEAMEVSL